MQSKHILVIFVFLISLSCRKKYDFPDPSLNKLVGTWRWIETAGGFTGVPRFPAVDGSDALRYEFTERAICIVRTKNDKSKLSYSLSKSTAYMTRKEEWFLSMQRTGLRKYQKIAVVDNLLQFSGNDTLMLSIDAADGTSSIFVREK